MVRDVVEPNGFGIVDQHAENAAPFGQMADLLAHLFVDAFVDELDQFMVVPAHTQRPIPGVYELDRGVHDRAERFVQFEPRGDDQHGVEQAVEPVAALHDLLDAVLDLYEQLSEPQLGQRVAQRAHAGLSARLDRVGHGSFVSPDRASRIAKFLNDLFARGCWSAPAWRSTPMHPASDILLAESEHKPTSSRRVCSRAIADTAHHLLLHDEMGYVEGGVADGAAAATTISRVHPSLRRR